MREPRHRAKVEIDQTPNPSGMPRYCMMTEGYVYFRCRGMLRRLPDLSDKRFWGAYRKALDSAPRKKKGPPPLFAGTTINIEDLNVLQFEMMRGAKSRAKAAKREFSLPKDWLVERFLMQKGRCALSGIKMRNPEFAWDPYGPSIDRINSEHGYTEENSQLTLFAVNLGKNRFSLDDYVKVCRAVSNKRKNAT